MMIMWRFRLAICNDLCVVRVFFQILCFHCLHCIQPLLYPRFVTPTQSPFLSTTPRRCQVLRTVSRSTLTATSRVEARPTMWQTPHRVMRQFMGRQISRRFFPPFSLYVQLVPSIIHESDGHRKISHYQLSAPPHETIASELFFHFYPYPLPNIKRIITACN